MKVLIRKLDARLQQLSPLAITTLGLCLVLGLGAIDYHTPRLMSFVLFYMLVAVLVGRYTGTRHAVFVSGVAAIMMAMDEWGLRPSNAPTGWMVAWNDSLRFVAFSIAGWLAAELTRLTRHLSQLVEERTAQWKAEVEQHKTTSTRLAESLERFEQVINSITEVFWLSNVAKDQMAYLSPGYERIWGRKCEEVYRNPRSWLQAVHPADRDEVLRRAQTDQAAGNYDVEYRILRPDGAVRWIRDRAFPVRNQQGEVYRLAGLAEDITERKRTRELLQTQAAILENMAEGVIVTDEKGVIVQMNPAGERIWGYGRNEVLGQPVSVLSGLPEPEASAAMQEVLAALQATGSWRGTFKNRRKDGTIIFCDAIISRLELPGRKLLVAVEQDVTERMRTQEQLQMQARVLESMAEAALMTDETGKIILTNPALEVLLGYERGELVGQPMHVLAAVSVEAHNRIVAATLERIKTCGSAAGEYIARKKDGSLTEVGTHASGVNIGGRWHLVIVGQDITERRRAEEALRQSEETLRVFLDAVPEPALLLDRDGKILANNKAMAQRLGLPGAGLLGKYAFDLIPPEIAESRKAVFDQVLRSRQAVRFEDARAGRHFVNFQSPVLDNAGNVTRVAIFAFDITERKQAELVLRESEQTYRTLVETTGTGYLILDEQGRVLDANAEYVRLSGHKTLREILGRSVLEWTAPGQKEENAAAIEDCLRTGAVRNLEVNYVTPDGQITSIEINGTVVPTKKGRTILALCRDITQRKRTESALARQEALYRSILVTAMDGFFALDFTADPGGAIIEVNDAYCRLIGYSREELLQMRMADLEAMESPEEVTRHGTAIMALGAERFETRHRRKDGEQIQVEISVSKLAGTHARVFGFLRDITERKRAQAALRDAHDKLELRVEERTAELQAANAALRESEARLRLALEASNAGAWSWNAADNRSDWDQRYHELYGFEPEEPISFDDWLARVHPEDRERLLRTIQRLREPGAGEIWNEEFRALHPAKGERWMAGLGRVERDQAGQAMRMAGINLDITERKLAEEARRAQLAQIEAIYQSAPVGLCVLDTNFRYRRVNERLAALNGLPAAQHIGRTMREVVPNYADGAEAICRQVMTTGQPVLNLEVDGMTSAEPGVIRTGVTHWVPLKEADGRVAGISVVVEDVTERKTMVRALKESEQKYRRLHESMTDAFVRVDLSGRITEFNPAYLAMLSYEPDELRNLTYVDLTPQNWHAMETHIVAEQVLARGYSDVYEKEYRRKDGTIFPVELRTFLICDTQGQPAAMWAIVRDITRRKQAEAALREAHETLEARVRERTAELQAANAALAESEERYRSLVTNLNVGVYRNTPGPQGRFIQANPALARMHGYASVEEFQKVKVADLYQQPGQRQEFVDELLRQGAVVNHELLLRKKDGTAIHASVNATVHRGPNGEADWIDGTLEDITERKHVEAALHASEERYRALAESSPDAIFILDRDIKVQYVNSTAAALWRRPPEDLIGLPHMDIFPPESAQRHSQVVAEVFQTGQPVRRDEPLVFPTGEQWIDIRLVPLYGEQRTVNFVMGVYRDITERKRAERQLSEALDLNQKMVAVSSMGIAAYRASGECVFANEALAHTVGGSVNEVLQGNFRHLESWQKSGLLQLAEKALTQGQALRGDFYTTTRFGKSIWADSHLTPFVSNGQPHLLLMLLDITERKRAEALLHVQRDLGVRLSLTSELNVALNQLIEVVTHMEPVDCGGILLLDPPTGELHLATHRGVSAEFAAAVSHIGPDAPQARIIRAGQPVYQAYSRFPIVRSPALEKEGLRASALIPLSHEGTILGSLNVASHRFDEFPPQTRMVIESIAAQAAGAIARIRAEEALRQSETRLRALISSAPVVIFAVDRDGIIRFEDGQALKSLGATRGANVGRSVMETYAHVPAIIENARRALQGEEFEAVVEAGQTTLDCWYSPLRDKDGNPAGYIGVATNVTERHRLQRQILEISDREQARIGQDIHDGLCQQLVSLAFDANALQRELTAQKRPEARIAHRIANYLDKAITESRHVSRGLFPVRLRTVGLSPALEELAKSISARFDIQCHFESEGPVAFKHATLATHLYRIAQEAVANAVKHSHARTVRICLRAQARQIELTVEDNGKGFSPAKRKKATGLGLHIMDYRARAVGGTLLITPRPRGGTIVSCCVLRPKS